MLDPTPAGWKAAAAYLYVLRLDGAALAWEYLRRNHEYRESWRQPNHTSPQQGSQHWGLRFHRRSRPRCPPGSSGLVRGVHRRHPSGSRPRAHMRFAAPVRLEASRAKALRARRRTTPARLRRVRHRRTREVFERPAGR